MRVTSRTPGGRAIATAVRQLKDYPLPALREELSAAGLPRYRADQLVGWVYARGCEDLAAMSDLPTVLRERLQADWALTSLRLVSTLRGVDGTIKGTLRAVDGSLVETVLIPERNRMTLCVSTQVGCPLACAFCATGAMGFRRNLRTAEIVDQVCRMRKLLPANKSISHIVFMGMGEPLLNLPAVVPAIHLLLEPRGFAFAPRRITVSTAGVVPQIDALLGAVPVNLAVSLHATEDALRDQLVPLNRRFPLATLLGALRQSSHFSRRHPIFFEYTLMAGLNDAPDDARRLASLLHDLPAKVNLIPMNPHPHSSAQPPSAEVIQRFASVLRRSAVTATVRRPRGVDIDAACGQLAARSRRTSPPPARGVA